MKRYSVIYYLLFMLIIMGAFASMAQNEYGTSILGFATASFSALFLVQVIYGLLSKKIRSISEVLEPASLFVLAGILALRVFYIRFQFVEFVFGAFGILLMAVYLYKLMKSGSSLKLDSKKLVLAIRLFYLSIVLYLISMITVPFFPGISEPAGVVAFVLLIVSVILSFISKGAMTNGEKISGYQFVSQAKDRSGVLAILFLLFTVYMGSSKIGLMPPMYSDEFPQSYYKLVNQAEAGKEQPVNGKYKHEVFKTEYDRFVKRNASSTKK